MKEEKGSKAFRILTRRRLRSLEASRKELEQVTLPALKKNLTDLSNLLASLTDSDELVDDTGSGDDSGIIHISDITFDKLGEAQGIIDISKQNIDMNNFYLKFVIDPLNLAGIMHGCIFSFYNWDGNFRPDARFNGGRLQMAIFGDLGDWRKGLINMFIAHDVDKDGGFIAGDKTEFTEIRSSRAIDWTKEHKLRLEVKRIAVDRVAITVDVDGNQVYHNHENDFYFNPSPQLVFGADYYGSQFANIPGAKLSQIRLGNL